MGDFLDYFKNKKNLANLLLLGILVMALPIAVQTMRQQQIINSRATADTIVFTGNNLVNLPGNKLGFKLDPAGKPVVALEISSPIESASQTAKSQNIFMSLVSNGGLVGTVYAGHCERGDPGSTNTYCDNGKIYQDQPDCSHADTGETCGGDDGGGNKVCNPGDMGGYRCTGNCAGCGADEGEGAVKQCNSSGTGWDEIRGECTTQCAGPCKSSRCSNPDAGDGAWRYECQDNTACAADLKQGVGVPFHCENGQWKNTNPLGECTTQCTPSSTCPSGQNKVDKSKIGQRFDDNIVGKDLQSYKGTGECGYKYYKWESTLGDGNVCTTFSFGPWEDQTQCPKGACTVGNWIFSNAKPAANTLIKATVKGTSSGTTWTDIAYKVDSGSWTVPPKVDVTGGASTPTFSFDVDSGANGAHKIVLGINKGVVACTGTGTFNTGGVTDKCPADSNLTVTPSTVKVGETIVFQYKAGEDTNIGGDTWSAGIEESKCQFDLGGRKYTCIAQSATDEGYWNHRWENGAKCGSATYKITGTQTVTTTHYRIAESPTDFSETGKYGWQEYTTTPMKISYEFNDKTPGLKNIFVEFKGSDGKTFGRKTAQIKLLSADPTITSCSLTFETNNNTVLSLTGTDFGKDKGTIKSGDNTLTIKEWKDKSIKAIFPNAPEGEKLPVSVSNVDGQLVEGQCSAITSLALGAKVFCRTASAQDTDNVDLTLTGDFPGGTKSKQKVKIDREGNIAGLNQRMEEGKKYKLTLKAPKSVRKTVSFTAVAGGAVNIPNFVLPIGDIMPVPGGDGTINSLDKGELNRQWIIAQSATGRSGDFNNDGRVNSIDWACMRHDFGASDDPEPTAPLATPVPSVKPGPSVSPGASPTASPFSGTWQPFADANTFRDFIFKSFGFTNTAIAYIENNSSMAVKDLKNACGGGGGWMPGDKKVEVNCTQYEAALHELSHVWWHGYRLQNPDMVKGLAKDVVRMANGEGATTEAANFAKGYVNGIGDWKGMYCTDNGCADTKNIQDSDFDLTEAAKNAKIIDWEIYAGLSSWTMGRFKDGTRILPQYMWKYFEPQFKGVITEKPYYEGGHP